MNRETWTFAPEKKEIYLHETDNEPNPKIKGYTGAKAGTKTKLKNYLNKQSKINPTEKYNPSKTTGNTSKYFTKYSGRTINNRMKPSPKKNKTIDPQNNCRKRSGENRQKYSCNKPSFSSSTKNKSDFKSMLKNRASFGSRGSYPKLTKSVSKNKGYKSRLPKQICTETRATYPQKLQEGIPASPIHDGKNPFKAKKSSFRCIRRGSDE